MVAGFDPIKMAEAEASIFSTYLTAIEMYVRDLKAIAVRDGAVITKDTYNDVYYLQSVPTTDPAAYDTNGKRDDITYKSLLVAGKSCIFIGHTGTSENTGDNSGHYYGLHVTESTHNNALAIFFSKRGEVMPSFKVMNSHRDWDAAAARKKKREVYKDVDVICDSSNHDSTIDGVFSGYSRYLYSENDGKRVTGNILPLTTTIGWHERKSWFKDMGYRLIVHDPRVGAEFTGSWFVPNTYNGKWNVGMRMSPLCACLSAVLSNASCLGNGKMCVSEIPRLDENLVVKQDLNVGMSVASLFVNPLSVLGGNEVVYTAKKTVDASAWVNFIKELNFKDANNSPIELFARVDQAYIEDYEDYAVSMPFLVCTNILNGQKYANTVQLDNTFMVAPDFMLLDPATEDVLTSLTIDDLCYLVLKYGSTSSLNLVCGIDNATCTYSVTKEDVEPNISASCKTVVSNVERLKNKLSGYLNHSAIKDICSAYSIFFFHVLACRQCGTHVVLLSHDQVLMSKNQIMAEYEKSKSQNGSVGVLDVEGVHAAQARGQYVMETKVFNFSGSINGGENEEEVH